MRILIVDDDKHLSKILLERMIEMRYWAESVAEQVKKLKDEFPKVSERQLTRWITGSSISYRTNPPRERFKGMQETFRRKAQIARGFIQATN